MALLGVFGAASQFALIKAFQAAPPSAIAPFNYSTIVWATVLGLLVFGELPDLPTVVGAAVIIGSGLYVFHRERVVATGDAAAGLGTAAAAAPREAPATGPVAAAADGARPADCRAFCRAACPLRAGGKPMTGENFRRPGRRRTAGAPPAGGRCRAGARRYWRWWSTTSPGT